MNKVSKELLWAFPEMIKGQRVVSSNLLDTFAHSQLNHLLCWMDLQSDLSVHKTEVINILCPKGGSTVSNYFRCMLRLSLVNTPCKLLQHIKLSKFMC